MKRVAIALALMLPAACATSTTPAGITFAERPAPIEGVRVTVGERTIPVVVSTIPLDTSLREPDSPTRDHIRKLLLNAAI